LFPAKSKRDFVLRTQRKEKEGWNFLNDNESVVDTHMLLPTYPLTTETKKRLHEKDKDFDLRSHRKRLQEKDKGRE
jgi:hypothetical protein